MNRLLQNAQYKPPEKMYWMAEYCDGFQGHTKELVNRVRFYPEEYETVFMEYRRLKDEKTNTMYWIQTSSVAIDITERGDEWFGHRVTEQERLDWIMKNMI